MRLYRTRIPSALPTPASSPPPSPPPRGEHRGKGIDQSNPGYVSFRVMLLAFLQKDMRFWTGVLSFLLRFGEVGWRGWVGWMDGWLVLGEVKGWGDYVAGWMHAWGMHGRWTRGRESEGAFLGFEHVQ